MNDFSIGLELTRHCNLHCAHCFRADRTEVSEIPFATVGKILEEAKAYHRPRIALTGGEATLHSRFKEIVDLIVRHDYPFHYVTNGWNYEKVFRDLYPLFGDPHWAGVSFSLDGATRETHDAIRGKGSYDRVLAAIAVAATHKLEIVVQMVAHRGNRHEITPLALLCSKLGAVRLHVAHLQPTPDMVARGLLHSPRECREVEAEVRELSAHLTMPVIVSAGCHDETPLAHCLSLRNSTLSIDYRGRLTVCCQLSNFTGGDNESDIVADLSVEPLAEAHKKLLRVYEGIFDARLSRMKSGPVDDLDNFHCWRCMKMFRKVDWMRDFPDNEWVRQDPHFRTKETK